MAGNVRALNLILSTVLGSPAQDAKSRLEGLLTLISTVEGWAAPQKVLRMRASPGLCMLNDSPA